MQVNVSLQYSVLFLWENRSARAPFHSISISISILLVKEENTMIILRNPQIAELIEAGCAFKSNVIISKNDNVMIMVIMYSWYTTV